MYTKALNLVVDMYGCPNRCRHCWLGHMPNRKMEADADVQIINFFSPYFSQITYYSWLREPDFCDEYRERWEKDIRLSVNSTPQRFELASFWRIVRDPDYVAFLKSVDTKKVQLSFFGMEKLTDSYIGRKGAFNELLKATEILIDYQIAPRWQAFINEENKDEIVQLLQLSEKLRLKEKCLSFQGEFEFFVHEGSCDGENRKLYDIRIQKENVPKILIPYYLNYENIAAECEWIERLKDDSSHVSYHNGDNIILNISNSYDVYFNFTHMSKVWKIGNIKKDLPNELVRKIVDEDTPALNLARKITVSELVKRYGNAQSNRLFSLDDYKTYLFNCYLDDILN